MDPDVHETLRQLIHFIDEGPGHGFPSGALKEVLGRPFPTGVIWWTSTGKIAKYVEKQISLPGVAPTQITWNMYATGGTAIAQTMTDRITYTGIFEVSRIRSL
jgi:hypothetical protein